MREFIQDGRIKMKLNKYIFIKVGTKFIPEHRLVTEEVLGRLLEPNEVIHHIDFNKQNNKIENLMLFKNQEEHAKFHIKLIKYPYLTNPMKRQIEELSLVKFIKDKCL